MKVLTVLLVAAAAGAALGIMLTTDKGSNTRKVLSRKANDLIDQLNDKMEQGQEVLASLKKKSSEFAK
jgi:hypothetical protein